MSMIPPHSRSESRGASLRTLILAGLLALSLAGVVAAAEGTARVSGVVTGEDGEPAGELTVFFDPINAEEPADPLAIRSDEQAPRGQAVQAETNKKGKFVVGNFPVGTYQAYIESDTLAVKSMRYIGRAPDGSKVGDFSGDAGLSGRSPAFTLVTGLRATLEITIGEKPAELPTISDVVQARDTSPVLTELNALFAQQSWPALEAKSAEVIAEFPDLGGAHYLRAVALWRNGKLDEAAGTMRQAVELVPDQPGIRGTLGALLIDHGAKLAEAGEQDRAAAVYGEAAEHLAAQLTTTPGDVSYLTNRVIALDRSGQIEPTIAALDALIAADPGQIRAYLHKAELLTDSGRPDEAMAVIETIPGGGLPAASAVYNAAVELYNAGKMEATIAATNRAIEMAPDQQPLFYQLKGRALIKLGRDAEGIEVLKKYLSMVPEDDEEAMTDRALVEALGGGGA